MSTTVIPQTTVKNCDVCLCIINRDNARYEARIQLARAGLDLHGHAVGSNNIGYDLCDACLSSVENAMRHIILDRRPKADAQKD